MLGFFVNPTKRIASESFLTSQHLPVGQAWSIEFYRFFLCLLGVSHSSTVNPPTFILNGPKRCWLSHPLKVVNAFKRLSLSGVQALICEDLWLTFSVMNSKKHVTEDKEWQDQPGSHPTPEQMTYMYNLYDIYIYTCTTCHFCSLLVLILFSTCWWEFATSGMGGHSVGDYHRGDRVQRNSGSHHAHLLLSCPGFLGLAIWQPRLFFWTWNGQIVFRKKGVWWFDFDAVFEN